MARYNCERCGETYDEDNLATCRECDRSFCYRCGDFRDCICFQCPKSAESPQQSEGQEDQRGG
jgi:hypothetical protein